MTGILLTSWVAGRFLEEERKVSRGYRSMIQISSCILDCPQDLIRRKIGKIIPQHDMVAAEMSESSYHHSMFEILGAPQNTMV